MSEEEKDEKKDQEKKEDKMDRLSESFSPLRNAARYLNIPFTLLSTTMVGALIGYFLEQKWPTGGIFIMVFSMLGVAAGFREIIRIVKNSDNNKKK